LKNKFILRLRSGGLRCGGAGCGGCGGGVLKEIKIPY